MSHSYDGLRWAFKDFRALGVGRRVCFGAVGRWGLGLGL